MIPLRQGYGGQDRVDCPREQEVVNAVLCGRWPERCDESLVAHAAQCATCREVAQVSVLLHEDVDQSRIDVIVPAAGQVWWRAAVRARLESTHAAARPMSWMHAITGAIVLGALLAAITAVWPMVPGLVRVVRSVPIDLLPSSDVANAIAAGLAQSLVVGLVAAAILVVAPLAVYFVLSDD